MPIVARNEIKDLAIKYMSIAGILAEERRRRLAAERLLELKQAELFAANRKLGQHARNLSNEIVETRAEVANVRDENMRVKSDLSAAQERIQRVERRLWHSLETIDDGFGFFTSDLELIMMNDAYLALFDGLEDIKQGVSYVTILQLMTEEGIVDIGNVHPADWRQRMIDRMQRPEPENEVMRLWDGRYIKMLDQRGPDGDIISLRMDITESVEYENKLRDARENAESANRAKSSFLANMSHELRTPMNGVVGMADLLNESELSEEQRLYVDTIKSSGEALLVIINDVLDYSKIEADKLELHLEAFDLEKSIHDVVRLLQSSARDKGLYLFVDYDLLLTSQVIGDPGRMRQVLTNLIGNAVKFTSEGYVRIKVTGTPGTSGGDVALRVSVQDTGIGIPEDMQAHIFGEFNQVENERNRKFDGTGLGLAITRRLIKLMGGDISVTSKENEGSCFSFEINLDTIGPADIDRPVLNENLQHVMIIDNFQPGLDLLQSELEQLGLKVTACNDAKNALELLDSTMNLILVDHVMEGMSGIEFGKALRKQSSDTAMILLSTNAGHARRDAENGVFEVIAQRPFLRTELFSWLEQYGTAPQQIAPPKTNETITEFVAKDVENAPPPVDATTPVRRMRILAAEDNKTNRLVFSKMIKSLDVDLVFAVDGIEAVEKYQELDPDLIFMDISMPRLDGKDACRQIREIEKDTGRHVPVVALTAHAMTDDDREIIAAGLDHYMTKPLRKPEIIARILAHCPKDAVNPAPDLDQAAG